MTFFRNLHLTFKIDDVFVTRICETEGFAGLQKCGWSEAWEWQSHDLAERKPEAAEQAAER
jgi:hypothetical protein